MCGNRNGIGCTLRWLLGYRCFWGCGRWRLELRGRSLYGCRHLCASSKRYRESVGGYHLLALAFLFQTASASVQKLLRSRDPTSPPSDESDSRAPTVQFGTAGVAVLLFFCFGMNEGAVPCLPKKQEEGDHRSGRPTQLSVNVFRQGTVTTLSRHTTNCASPTDVHPPEVILRRPSNATTIRYGWMRMKRRRCLRLRGGGSGRGGRIARVERPKILQVPPTTDISSLSNDPHSPLTPSYLSPPSTLFASSFTSEDPPLTPNAPPSSYTPQTSTYTFPTPSHPVRPDTWWDRATDGVTIRTSHDTEGVPSLPRTAWCPRWTYLMQVVEDSSKVDIKTLTSSLSSSPSLRLSLPGARISAVFEEREEEGKETRRWSDPLGEVENFKNAQPNLVISSPVFTHPRRPPPRPPLPVPVHIFHRTVKRSIDTTSLDRPPPINTNIHNDTNIKLKPSPPSTSTPCLTASSTTSSIPISPPDWSAKVEASSPTTTSPTLHHDAASTMSPVTAYIPGASLYRHHESLDVEVGDWDVGGRCERRVRACDAGGWYAPPVTWKRGDKRPYWAEAWYTEKRMM
ncbi:hypothetical protein BC829DRAFT_422778 [Chytridium lagenaria]|nr:hypothetical protein BC829DRAFT_422778 [Chytridium lagenaria]